MPYTYIYTHIIAPATLPIASAEIKKRCDNGPGPEKPRDMLLTKTDSRIIHSRSDRAASDGSPTNGAPKALQASDPKTLSRPTGRNPAHRYADTDHRGNHPSVNPAGQANITPAEVTRPSCTAGHLPPIATKLNRRLYRRSFPKRFKNSNEADTLITHPHRSPRNK
jgi:hypothetical protein